MSVHNSLQRSTWYSRCTGQVSWISLASPALTHDTCYAPRHRYNCISVPIRPSCLAPCDQLQCIGVQCLNKSSCASIQERTRRHKEGKTGGAIQNEKFALKPAQSHSGHRTDPLEWCLPAFQPLRTSHVKWSDPMFPAIALHCPHFLHVVKRDDVEDTRLRDEDIDLVATWTRSNAQLRATLAHIRKSTLASRRSSHPLRA